MRLSQHFNWVWKNDQNCIRYWRPKRYFQVTKQIRQYTPILFHFILTLPV